MKTIFYSTVVIVMTLFTSCGSLAQNTVDTNKNNYVVLTKKVPQLEPIILTAEALKEEDGSNFGQFEVIICGKEIGDITDSSKMNGFIVRAENVGVKLVACGFSLKVDTTKVPDEMKTVENGILYNLQLQKKGYNSLSL
jgi:intracellular sulfur oxidation DsrE/DsrF family protein